MKLTKIGQTTDSRESGSVYYLAKRHDEEGDIVANYREECDALFQESDAANDGQFADYLFEQVEGVEEQNGFTFPFYPKGYRCHCEHDCCAHTFLHAASIVGYDPITEEFIIKQSWGINV